ncbi:MAG: hypothetical protein NT069_18380, partial [Planctomycetota bacterium]|nr:hypothetical protein [Planctomycetota bacterium]
TVGISVSVCGHLLRIAPRFDYRRDVVDAVRSRVAKVEDNINRLRRLPRAPVQASTADTGPAEIPEVETWYYYTSRNGDKTLHLLVPSPEHPTWWYTPHAANLSQYANLPRDTSRSAAEQGASETEREHLSPLRDSVMRMVLPFTDANDKLQRVVDLAMPWDRANFDSLPDEKAIPDDQQRIALVMRLSEIEAAFLGTAFKPVGKRGQDEVALWNAQEKALDRVPLTEFEVVSDPRPESGARVFWTLADQMNRPDGAFPYRYRPVDELVAEGFAGVAVDNLVSKGLIRRERRDDISRLLRYEQIRQRAVTQSLFEDSDPRPARRMAQTRAGLLSTILADFVREAGPKTYGPIEELKLVRTDDGVDRPVVSRRRAPLWVKPDLTMKYVVEITYAILENNTDLDLEQKEGEPQNNFRFTWKSKGQTKTADFDLSKLKLETDRLTPLSLIPPIEIDLADDPTGIFVSVERQSPNRKADLRFEPLPIEFANLPSEKLTRQVGLFAETEADLRLDLDRVRIVRNETDSDSDDWSRDRPIRIVPMSGTHGNDPIEEIQRWVVCLPPCQEFITDDETDSPAKSARVRVRLPVKFEEELLKSQLPRLNSFEIYRRFPWDSQPVKIAEGVPPNLRLVKDRDSAVLLVESFLFGEDFSFDLLTRRFEGTARGVVPGVTPIEYSLRAIPFGRLPSDTRDPVTLRWSAVTLYAPPAEKRLPALGLVFPVESLFDTDSNS